MTAPSTTAIVTGGAKGIGAATARRLARDGHRIVLVDVDPDAADEVRAQVETDGGACEIVVGDIAPDETVALRGARLDEGGHDVTVLVNNVGDFRPARAVFHKSDASQWRRLHELN